LSPTASRTKPLNRKLQLSLCWLVSGSLWLTSGCTSTPAAKAQIELPQVSAPPAQASASQPAVKKHELALPESPKATKHFTADTLYSLLAAEIAGSREHYELASSNYLQQAKETQDPQIAERATLIARFLEDHASTAESAQIWLAAAPDNHDALANASFAYSQLGQPDKALAISEQLFRLGGEPLFQYIAANSFTLTTSARAPLIARYQSLMLQHPQHEQLLLGTALLLQQQSDYPGAMTLVQKALKLYSQSAAAAVLEANLLHQLKRDPEALSKMSQLLEQYPDNTSLRQQYARILTRYDLKLAQQQFRQLSQQLPGNGEILLSLGIIALENQDLTSARASFEALLNQDQHISTAHYYLGRLAEADNDPSSASLHYLQVEDGKDFFAATLKLLHIFIAQKDYLSASEHLARLRLRNPEQSEELYLLHSKILIQHHHSFRALDSLNQGLKAHPDSQSLVFARAMLNYERLQLAAAERDLRSLLARNPEHIGALNSLGYLLADKTQRFDEAQTLLTKALSLSPKDPAIMDSMGWLLYRTGNYPEALKYLRQAYAQLGNAEVSAHLGEVLWQSGALEEARNIWQQGLKQAPADPIINSTLKRLKADL
jgi:tetratricopeptide (TPR) repeat protein